MITIIQGNITRPIGTDTVIDMPGVVADVAPGNQLIFGVYNYTGSGRRAVDDVISSAGDEFVRVVDRSYEPAHGLEIWLCPSAIGGAGPLDISALYDGAATFRNAWALECSGIGSFVGAGTIGEADVAADVAGVQIGDLVLAYWTAYAGIVDQAQLGLADGEVQLFSNDGGDPQNRILTLASRIAVADGDQGMTQTPGIGAADQYLSLAFAFREAGAVATAGPLVNGPRLKSLVRGALTS